MTSIQMKVQSFFHMPAAAAFLLAGIFVAGAIAQTRPARQLNAGLLSEVFLETGDGPIKTGLIIRNESQGVKRVEVRK